MRRRPLSLLTLVMVLLTAAPTAALAAEEPAAVPPEAPAAETPPPSTGWVPQDAGAEDAGSANAPAQRGSSLGSGESSNSDPAASEPSAPPAPPAPVSAPVDPYEPETSAAPIGEESTSGSEAETAPVPVEPVAKVEPDPGVPPAVGAADLVARSASSQGADNGPSAAQVANTSVQGASDSGGLPWLALVFCGLILLYAGMRLLLGPVEPEFFRSGRFRFFRRVFPGA